MFNIFSNMHRESVEKIPTNRAKIPYFFYNCLTVVEQVINRVN